MPEPDRGARVGMRPVRCRGRLKALSGRAGAPIDVEARVAMLAGLAALALLGPQRCALDLRQPALSAWSRAEPSEPARKAA